jgi:16S rRNA (guanine966-N2)-methyltransferase
VRIVTGRLRGRTIPFNPKRHGDIRVTSGRLKEAVFDRLGSSLEELRFLDICAGSGQMALEAYSRGALVTAVEPDRRRRELLLQLLRDWGVSHLQLLGRCGQGALTDLAAQNRRYDIIYLDPPYHARHDGQPLSEVLLSAVGHSGVLDADGSLLVQHPKEIDLSASVEGLERSGVRSHGTTILSEYRSTCNDQRAMTNVQ